tara:strand:+ start:150 stop:764 length:615 start_codon:yes stop_codon:yes gene_type:complete
VEAFDEQQLADAAWLFLRSNSTATVKFNEHMHEISYVINHEGVLVIPAMVAMLQPCDIVMFIPEYCEDCIEMHVSLQEFKEDGVNASFADRWQVYHGVSPDVQWATVEIDAARFHEAFVDGEHLQRENLLFEIEPALCKELNKNHVEHVQVICKKLTNVEVQDPVVVGVDQLGIDIRASFGIIRVPAGSSFFTSDDVITFVSGG